MKVEELSGADLDFWVAKAEGVETQPSKHGNYGLSWKHSEWVSYNVPPHYSSDWATGGPIIERDHIKLDGRDRNGRPIGEWAAKMGTPRVWFGPLP